MMRERLRRMEERMHGPVDREQVAVHEAEVDLKKEIDGFSLGQGGGQKFKVVVSDDEGGERRTGGILETWRRLYVVEVKMQGLDSTAGTIDILKDEFSSHCIDILNLGEEEVAHRSNMSTNEDFDKFTEEAMKVCSKYKEYDYNEPIKPHNKRRRIKV